ncbi:MAG: ZIP family metal transporter [Pseudomonadota bacterium]
MEIEWIKLGLVVAVVASSLIAGWPALRAQVLQHESAAFGLGEAFAAGIFLGAGLIHMLGDASSSFQEAGVDYPVAMVLCGAMMLLLLWIEHLGAGADHAIGHGDRRVVPVAAVVMLSIHSILMGAAFGVSTSVALTITIFVAVLAHKGAASFALALELRRAGYTPARAWTLFMIFVAMFPLGALVGEGVQSVASAYPLSEASVVALAAGTFLFFGTLHGLAGTPMIVRCCNPREFMGAVTGFALMALVAIWT